MCADLPSPMSIQDDWAVALIKLADLFGLTEPGIRHVGMVDARCRPRVLAAVQHLPMALDRAGPIAQPICEILLRLQHLLHWSQNPNYTDQDFLRGYAYCELVGPHGHIQHGELALGLLLLQPRITYPEHAHPAKETYLVLSGHAQWKQGDGRWRARGPGDLITHASAESHAMRTKTEPLLAAYLWQDHLDVGAHLLNPVLRGTRGISPTRKNHDPAQ